MTSIYDAIKSIPGKLQGYLMIEGSPLPMALFRIALGASIYFEAVHNLGRARFYTPETFHFSYFDAITPLPAAQMIEIFEVQAIFALMLLVGALTPLAALGVLATQGYAFLVCQLNFRNHIYLALLLTALVLVSPAWRALSVDALARWGFWRFIKKEPDRARPPEWVPVIAQRLVGLQICAVYLYAALHKLSPGFLSGYPIGKVLSRKLPRAWLVKNEYVSRETAQVLSDLAADPRWAELISYLTVASEGFLAIGLLFKPTRMAAVFVGLGLHLSIGLSMDILTFGTMMCAGYICFWMPRQRPILAAKPPE